MKRLNLLAVSLAASGLALSVHADAAPYLATVGSPNSLQHSAVSTALDLSSFDFDNDPDVDGFAVEGDADTIGGAFTYWGSAGQEGQRYDLRYEKAFRASEGSRARILVTPVLNILHANNVGTATLGTLSVGVELPVQPNWLITPRIAYGITDAGPKFGSTSSELLTLSASSRYKIAQLGRGDLTIGNMVGWSRTLDLGLGREPGFYIRENVFTFRNGLAYQLPFKGRMFGGRQGSLRASYTWTKLTDDPQSYEDVHEAAINVGVRLRETAQKSGSELLRVGLIYTHGTNSFSHDFDYDAVTLTVGYRF
jgi:hypothetical protein